jgi:hypothetical protein
MTALEFKTEYLTQYDQHGDNAAPGHTDYTISYWLTVAQEELVKNYLDPKWNLSQVSFEEVEKRRVKLQSLVKPATFSTPLPSDPVKNISINSFRFSISGHNILEIKQEMLITEPSKCYGMTQLPVVPLLLDEYNDMVRNPFRQPSSWRAYRLNTGADNPDDKTIEIITKLPFISYNIRYVMRPRPIIVGNLTSLGVSLDGETSVMTSELDESMHREIISRAVTLSLETIMSPRIQTHPQLGNKQSD